MHTELFVVGVFVLCTMHELILLKAYLDQTHLCLVYLCTVFTYFKIYYPNYYFHIGETGSTINLFFLVFKGVFIFPKSKPPVVSLETLF